MCRRFTFRWSKSSTLMVRLNPFLLFIMVGSGQTASMSGEGTSRGQKIKQTPCSVKNVSTSTAVTENGRWISRRQKAGDCACEGTLRVKRDAHAANNNKNNLSIDHRQTGRRRVPCLSHNETAHIGETLFVWHNGRDKALCV